MLPNATRQRARRTIQSKRSKKSKKGNTLTRQTIFTKIWKAIAMFMWSSKFQFGIHMKCSLFLNAEFQETETNMTEKKNKNSKHEKNSDS